MEVSGQPWPLYSQGKSPWYPLDRRLGGSHSCSGHSGKEKNPSPCPELNPRTPIVQPIAQCYTDWVIMALVIHTCRTCNYWTKSPSKDKQYIWSNFCYTNIHLAWYITQKPPKSPCAAETVDVTDNNRRVMRDVCEMCLNEKLSCCTVTKQLVLIIFTVSCICQL
jgi:hypothetical protein